MAGTFQFDREDKEVDEDEEVETVVFGSKIGIVPREWFRSSVIVHLDFTNAKNLRRIADNAFIGCNSLKDAVFPEGMETVGKFAFSGCTKLLFLLLNEGLCDIENGAFHECYSIVNLCLPSTVERICKDAFSSNTGLVRAALNNTLKVGGGAFKNCPNLKKVGVSEDATIAKDAIPKRKRFPPKEVFDEVFPRIEKLAEKLGIELPGHAPRFVDNNNNNNKSTFKKFAATAAVPDGQVSEKMMQCFMKEGFSQMAAMAAGGEETKAELREQKRQVAALMEDKKKLAEELEETKGDLVESQRSLEEAKEYIDKMTKECTKMKEERDGLMKRVQEQSKTVEYNQKCRKSLAAELYRASKDVGTGKRQAEALKRENRALVAKNTLMKKKAERDSARWSHEASNIRGHNVQTITNLEETKKSLEETKNSLEEEKAASRETKTRLKHIRAKLEEVTKERDELQSKLKYFASESKECASEATAESSQGLLARFVGKRKADTMQSPPVQEARKSTKTDKLIVREL